MLGGKSGGMGYGMKLGDSGEGGLVERECLAGRSGWNGEWKEAESVSMLRIKLRTGEFRRGVDGRVGR